MFHDWTFLDVAVNWKEGSAEIRLRGPAGSSSIRCNGISGLSLSRTMPWGPSESINRAVLRASENPVESHLLIEMQSGDAISISASGIQLPDEARPDG